VRASPEMAHGFDYRQVRATSWALLAVAAADLVLWVASGSGSLPSLPVELTRASAFVFAGAVLQVVSRNRLVVVAALLLTGPSLLELLAHGGGVLGLDLSDTDPISLLYQLDWLCTLAGAALLGAAIGGVRTSRGWVAVILGLLMASLGVAQYLSLLAEYGASAPSGALVMESLAGQFVLVGWAYLLGAALERSWWLTAIGALLALGWVVALWLLSGLAPATPGSSAPDWLVALLGLIELAGWVMLIIAAVIELPALNVARRAVEPTVQ
jgi:hypothetical protein